MLCPDKRVVVYRILPALTSEFVNPDMVPFVLPNVLLIAEQCTKDEYVRLILPDLTPVFKQQEPIQVRPQHSLQKKPNTEARALGTLSDASFYFLPCFLRLVTW